MPRISPRGWVMGVGWLSFALNFLDRQLLAAVAPSLKAELSLAKAQYGQPM